MKNIACYRTPSVKPKRSMKTVLAVVLTSGVLILLVSLLMPYQVDVSLMSGGLSVGLSETRAYAAVDFFSSFENGYRDWDDVMTSGASLDTSKDWSSDGTYSLKVSGVGTLEDRAYLTHNISGNPVEFWASADMYLPVIPSFRSGEYINSLGPDVYGKVGPLYDVYRSKWGIMYLDSRDELVSIWETGSHPIAAATKFTLQLHALRSAASGVLQLWFNGVEIINRSGLDTGQLDVADIFIGQGWNDFRISPDFTSYYDNFQYSEHGQIPYSVTPQPPVAQDDSYSLNQDIVLNISAPGVLSNDTDANGDALTVIKASNPAHGLLILNANGSFAFTPEAGYTGSDLFTYKANDGQFDSNIAVVNLEIFRINHAPVAQNEAYSIDEDTLLDAVTPGVLGNDIDADDDTLIAVKVSDPAHGALLLKADGSFNYLPAANYNGRDSFTYQAYDGLAGSNVATVSINIAAVNDVPVAQNNSFTTNQNTVLNIPAPGLLSNDTDVDGDILTAALVNSPGHGALTLNANGGFIYSPATNYIGNDSFTYRARDGKADSDPAAVTITIGAVTATFGLESGNQVTNQNNSYLNAMRFQNTAGTGSLNKLEILFDDTTPNGRVRMGVYADNNGVPGPGNLLLDAGETAVSNGWVSIGGLNLAVTQNTYYWLAFNMQSTNRVRYQSSGPSRSHYWVRYSYGALPGQVVTSGASNNNNQFVLRAAVTTVINVPPVATDDAFSMNEDAILTLSVPGVLGNDYDADGDQMTAIKVGDPTHGMLTFNTNGSFIYTPAANYNGVDSFVYRVNDGKASSNIATVRISVTAVNDAPEAQNDSYSTTRNTVLTIAAPGVLGNDIDVDGDALTVVVVNGPGHGALNLGANGGFTYTPAAGYLGGESFTYRANDTGADSNMATVSITVLDINVTPVAANDTYNVDEDITLVVIAPGVLGNDTDANGDSLTAVLVGGAAHGALTLNSNGSFTYTPSANYNGGDTFTYRVNDSKANSNTATVTIAINAVNDAPVAVNDTYSVITGYILMVATPGLLGNDTDVDGDPLTVIKVGDPAHGILVLNTNGSLTYTPSSGYTGSDTFTYKSNDGQVDSNAATVNITVTAAASTFGLDTGTSNWHEGSDMLDAMRFQNTAGTGLMTKLEVLFDDTTPNGKVRLGIYADNNGVPGSLLLDAGEVTVTNGWVSIDGLSLSVTQNTYYWLAFGLQRDNVVKIQAGPAESHYWINRAYGALPGSYSGTNYNAGQYVMRATVTR
jgi:VCBS repeat-containing protein